MTKNSFLDLDKITKIRHRLYMANMAFCGKKLSFEQIYQEIIDIVQDSLSQDNGVLWEQFYFCFLGSDVKGLKRFRDHMESDEGLIIINTYDFLGLSELDRIQVQRDLRSIESDHRYLYETQNGRNFLFLKYNESASATVNFFKLIMKINAVILDPSNSTENNVFQILDFWRQCEPVGY